MLEESAAVEPFISRGNTAWVMVTSWNEWYENTHIESSERYGERTS